MKLIEVLARELESWAGDVAAITQDAVTGELYDHWHCKLSGGNERSVSSLAEDAGPAHDGGSGSSVTQVQWEEAKNSMYLSFDPLPKWDGAGLPPVGTICEHSQLIAGEDWSEVEIVAHRTFDDLDYPCAVFVYRLGSSHSSEGDHFRPLRTPSQIYQDKALKEIERLYNEGGPAAVYDAGYRKRED